MTHCKSCFTVVRHDASSCPACGKDLSATRPSTGASARTRRLELSEQVATRSMPRPAPQQRETMTGLFFVALTIVGVQAFFPPMF
ncbi:MAG: hypothetical protein ACKO6N_18105 [Myxococcota bacterium]